MILYKRLDPDLGELKRATSSSAGFDLQAAHDETLYPGDMKMIGTGIQLELHDSMFATLHVRSSVGRRRLHLANGTGIIDADYRGEVKALLVNGSQSVVNIKKGDRLFQLIPQYRVTAPAKEVLVLGETDRGEGGFGSTGR